LPPTPPSPADDAAGPAGAPPAGLLRQSFSAVNARFHLAGLYALLSLVFLISLALAGDRPEWTPVALAAMVTYWGVRSGVLGLVYQAASTRRATVPFQIYARVLFLPLVWLLLKVSVIVYGLAAFGITGYYQASGRAIPENLLAAPAFFWGAPLFDLVTRVLLLYSQPICIRSREKGERGPHVRLGLAVLRADAAASRRLALLLLLIAGLNAALLYAHGPQEKDPSPDVAEALLLFATSYLELVVLYGAARVVLFRTDAARGEPTAPAPFAGGGEA
jgi:hypothetical protein